MKRSLSSPKSGPKKETGKAAPKTEKKAEGKIVKKAVTKKHAATTVTKKTAAKKNLKAAVQKAVKKVVRKSVKKTVKAAVKKAVPKSVKKVVKKVVTGLKANLKSALKKITPKKPGAKKPVAKASAKPAAKPVTTTGRPKSFPSRPAEKPFGFPVDTPELPDSYGEDRLVLMTQDPEYLFTYWEITPEQRSLSEQAKRDGEEYQEALRLNWIARDLFAPNFALLPVSLDARKGYLRVPFSGLSYQVEIGWVSDQGHFISILGRSNRSDAPESWKQTRARLKSEAGKRSILEYNLDITQPLGSSDLARTGRGELEVAGIVSDWGFEGPGALSSSASSGGVVRKTPPAARTAKSPKRRR